MGQLNLSATQLADITARPLGGQRNRVEQVLKLIRYSQRELAAEAGMTESDISDIVHGKYRRISLATAQTISGAFGVCTDHIFPPQTHIISRRKKHAPKSRRTRATSKVAA
jgi:transcriptional regulator with XRE-family HTH domain